MSTITQDILVYRADRQNHPSWNDWKWQLRNRIKSTEELSFWIDLSESETDAIEKTKAWFRWQITPYYASLIDPFNRNCPIRKQVVPDKNEFYDEINLDELDPLEELAHSPVKNVIHNYKDRVAFCVASECAVYCRYCLRKRMVGDGEFAMNKEELQQGINYIASTPEIKDVLLTGGDPLILSDGNLEWIISQLRKIDHLDIIRIGSRFPVLNPFRITESLCNMLKKYHPIWFNTHFNHPSELTTEARQACEMLTDHGIPVGNQTVLLRGINNQVPILKSLFTNLIKSRVRPYYLYQAQLIGGTAHFRTTIEEGMEIMNALRGQLSGFAIPLYVLDTPHGKVPLSPTGFIEREKEHILVRSYNGTIWKEYNPERKK